MSSSGEYIRLETTGRRTGRPHDVLVRFITVDGKIVVFPQNQGHQDWLENVRRNPEVTVYGGRKTIRATAAVKEVSGLGDPLLGAFTRKYGRSEVRKRYWGQRKYVEISILGQSDAGDYLELVYAELEAAFDGVAAGYDRHILGNAMNLWLRNRSVAHLSGLFKAGDVILEVGCGTGTETLAIAKHGVKVIASDISGKMLDVLRRKAVESGLQDLVVPVHARPYMIKERLRQLGYHRTDGAYSTYGAINTEPRLGVLFQDLHDLIKPGGPLLLGVWNKFCLYEMVGYSVRLKPAMAVARLRNPVPVGKSRFCISSTSYSVGSLNRELSGLFELQRVYGVGVLLPPSNLVRYLPPEPLLGFAKWAEVALEAHFPWNRVGDHFLGLYSRV